MNTNRPRILIVEDEWDTRAMLRRALAMGHYHVEDSTTVAGGMALLRTGQFGFVILDLRLPDGDGLDILREVRRKKFLVKVIVTSGTSDPARLKEAEELEPDLLLRKPCRWQDLIDFLEGHPGPAS